MVATLWFLAAITIVAAYFAGQVGESVESAIQSRRTADAMMDIASTRAEALFHLATDDFSQFGVGVDPKTAIALDDRPYLGVGTDVIRFQDSRGLLNLNFPDQVLLGQLLTSFGVPAKKHPALFDALADFSDLDNLRRLNGAEAAEYQAVNLPPPPNDWMYSPHQVKSVYGWHELNDLWNDGRFLSLLSTSRVIGFNPNTAPREILIAIAGKENAPLVDEILSLRKSNQVLAAQKAYALALTRSLDKEYVYIFPGDSVRITQQSPNLPWALEISLTVTLMRDSAPWHIDYYAKTRVKSKTSDEAAIPHLPFASSVPATAVGAPSLRPKP